MNIGERLRSIRIEKNISIKQLVLLSGISQATITRIESNSHSPSIDTLEKLCEGLEITLRDLIEDNNELPIDLINLISAAKKMSSTQRQKVTEMIESFLLKK